MDPRFAELDAEEEALHASRPGVVFRSRRALDATFYTLRRNAQEFAAFVDASDTPEMNAARLMRGVAITRDEAFEASRLLHNFAAAAISVVAHTRRHMDKHYVGTQALADYKAKVAAEWATWDLRALVQDFRNYLLHQELPMAASRTSVSFGIGSGTVRHDYVINVAELLRSNDWSPLARGYLESLRNELDLQQLVIDYLERVEAFREWREELEERSIGPETAAYTTRIKEILAA